MASTNLSRSTLNETVEIDDGVSQIVPSYFYKEIPITFELAGSLLNVAMVTYFIKFKKYQSPIFTILTSLAIMDTCACLEGVFYAFSMPVLISLQAVFLCVLSGFTIMLGLVGSEYHLLLFACLRFYQVLSPLKAKATITVSLMAKFCALIVFLSLCSTVAYSAHWRSSIMIIDREEVNICIFIGDTYSKDMAYLFIVTIIPCVTIFLVHVLKYFAYIRSKNMVDSQQERKSPDARAIAIVIALFYICLVPPMLYTVLKQYTVENYEFNTDSLSIVFIHVMVSNSIMNPMVYELAMKSIRDKENQNLDITL